MASTIKLKRSGTGGAIPSTTAISEGEVFINYYDGKLFFLKNQGGNKSIVTLSAASGGGATSLPDLSDVSISSPASGDLLKYNGTEWANAATIGASAVSGLSTVATSGAYADLTGKPSIPSAFDDLSDVTITSAASDQILKYNGSAWVNVSTISSSAVSGLASVATSGAYADLSGKPSIPSTIDDLSDVTITSAANGNLLQHNGSAWVNVSTIASSSVTGLSTVATSGLYSDLTGKPTLVTNLDGLSDVAITSAAIGQFIVHDGTQFVNSNTITASGAAIKPLVLKGAASQSANLLEAQNSLGTAQFSVGSAGAGYFLGSVGIGKSPTSVKLEIDAGSGAAFKTNTTGAEAATFYSTNTFQAVRMETNQTSCLHIITFQYSGSAKGYVGHNGTDKRTFLGNDSIALHLFESGTYSGRAGLNTTTPGAKFQIDTGAAATKGLIVKGAASQSANLLEVQNSSGTSLFNVASSGNVTVGDGSGLKQNIVSGGNSGTGGGAFHSVQVGGTAIAALGNYSAIYGTAYDATPTLYFNAAPKVTALASGAGTHTMKWNNTTAAWTYDTSSLRYKKDLRDSIYGLDAVLAMQPRQFAYKDDSREDVGFIAEEMILVVPELVTKNTDGLPDAVSYDRITSVLCKAVQELNAKVHLLELRLNGVSP